MHIPKTDLTTLNRTLIEHAGVAVHHVDKGASMDGVLLEAEVVRQLKEQYRVRFLPKQIIRRALSNGINPFKF